MYNKGQGVKQDTKKALKFYRLAADQGDYIAKTLIQTLLLTNSEFKYYNDQDTVSTNYTEKNITIPVHSISNSILFIAVLLILLIVGFALFHVFKPKKPVRKMPVFYSYIKENKNDEAMTEMSIFEETPILEEIPAAYFEPVQTVHETEIVEKVVEYKTIKKESLFECCYNIQTYDEEKLTKNSITILQRRRYQGSVMEYCYEECYH
jgi:TPR repeat protein